MYSIYVNLLALTFFSDDIENQSAAFLAKEADPDGSRTIGSSDFKFDNVLLKEVHRRVNKA